MIKSIILIFSLLSVILNAQTISSSRVYSIDGCDEAQKDWDHSCKAYFCVDSDGYAQILVSASTLLMGTSSIEGEYSGIAVWGFGDAEYLIDDSPDYYPSNGLFAALDIRTAISATSFWVDTSGGNWSSVNLTINFFDGDSIAVGEPLEMSLTLDAERDFVDTETCMWYPRSEGYYDGEFTLSLGDYTFNFYVCGDMNGETTGTFNGQAYGDVGEIELPAPIGTVALEFFLDIEGQFVEYEGRRFYHGFTNFSYVRVNGDDCVDDHFLYIFKPRVAPLLLTVTDNATAPGSISGFTIATSPPSGLGQPPGFGAVPINGGPQGVVEQSRFCDTSPEFMTICLGLETAITTTVEESTTEVTQGGDTLDTAGGDSQDNTPTDGSRILYSVGAIVTVLYVSLF